MYKLNIYMYSVQVWKISPTIIWLLLQSNGLETCKIDTITNLQNLYHYITDLSKVTKEKDQKVITPRVFMD